MSNHNIYKKYYPPDYGTSKIRSLRLRSKNPCKATVFQSVAGAKVIKIKKESRWESNDPIKQEVKSEAEQNTCDLLCHSDEGTDCRSGLPCVQVGCCYSESLTSALERLARSYETPESVQKQDDGNLDINMNVIESEELYTEDSDVTVCQGSLCAILERLANGIDILENIDDGNVSKEKMQYEYHPIIAIQGLISSIDMPKQSQNIKDSNEEAGTQSVSSALDRLAYSLFNLVQPKL